MIQAKLVVLSIHAKVSPIFKGNFTCSPCTVAECTSLKPALDTFGKFVKQLSISNNAIKRENAGKEVEFYKFLNWVFLVR